MLIPLIRQVEDGVAALLLPLTLAGFEFATETGVPEVAEVETLPETKGGIEEALVRPRVTVSYTESTFGTDKENTFFAGLGSPVAQEETVHVAVMVRAKGRKTDAGVYVVLEAVRGLLLGKVPFPGARGLWFTGQQLDDFETRGTWRYVLTVATNTVVVKESEPDEVIVGRLIAAFNLPPLP